MILLIYYLMLIIYVFLGVFFITLLERKILGIIQFRMGPNKIGFKGMIQSLSDAIKLLGKIGGMKLVLMSWLGYNFMPLGMMVLMLLLWGISSMNINSYSMSMLMILLIFSLSIFPIMFGGWFSGSLYSMIGAIRSIAQMISYEVSLIIIFMSIFILLWTFSLNDMNMMFGFLLNYYLMMMLFSSMMVEMNRTPFDLIEGESELVSGFNTEYFGMKFALIFLAEYGMIMYMCGLFSFLSTGMTFFSLFWSCLTVMMIMLVIWLRGIFPRIRYDKLMELCWVVMLNLSLSIFMLSLGMKLIIYWN